MSGILFFIFASCEPSRSVRSVDFPPKVSMCQVRKRSYFLLAIISLICLALDWIYFCFYRTLLLLYMLFVYWKLKLKLSSLNLNWCVESTSMEKSLKIPYYPGLVQFYDSLNQEKSLNILRYLFWYYWNQEYTCENISECKKALSSLK